MKKVDELSVIGQKKSESRSLTRREVVQRLLVGGSAALALPFVAAGHPIREHLANAWMLDEAEAKLAGDDWKPLFLNAQQNEDLVALAEAIVPGATKAEVNRFIDLLLSVETAGNQKKFVAALTAFEEESRKEFGKQFSKLDDKQQVDVLTKAAQEKNGTAGDADDGDDDESESSSKSEPAADLHQHFLNIKNWVSGAHYSSEIGMRELGWTLDRVFASYPVCEHEAGH